MENSETIILDIMMPGMDGIETCQLLRNIQGLKNSLIIFLTARGEDYSQIAGFDAGADDYITKPIKPKVLISRIQALFRRFRSIPELSGKIPTCMHHWIQIQPLAPWSAV